MLEGIRIDRLSISDVVIEQLYLKWENALLIKAEKIDLSALQSDDTPMTLEPLSKLPPYIRWSERWVEAIDIDIIKYKDFYSSLHYRKNLPGHISFRYNGLLAEGNFTLTDTILHLKLPSFTYNGADISGTFSVWLPDEIIESDLSLSLPHTPLLHFHARGADNRLRFSAQAEHPFSTLGPLVSFLNLDPQAAPWIVEYATFSSVQLTRMDGDFLYEHPEKLIRSLRAEATVTDAQYTFAQGFEPINAPQVDLLYAQGKLNIAPKNGSFYSLPTENSRVVIDFTAPHTMLDAHILTRHAKLNDSILSLLNHYGIHVPLKQTKGECAVDLTLSINLYGLDTAVRGVFTPTPSEILFKDISFTTEGGVVLIDHSRIRFDDFSARYGDTVVHARVQGEYNASTERGNVAIDAYDVVPTGNKQHLSLHDSRVPLQVTYTIAPEGDSLNVRPSVWNLYGEKLTVGAFIAPFDYRKAAATFGSVPFSLSNAISGTVDGRFDGLKKQTDIAVRMERFALGNIILSHAPMQIDLQYTQNKTLLHSSQSSAWSVHEMPVLLSPFTVALSNDEITFSPIEAAVGEILKGKFLGNFHLKTRTGAFRLSEMAPINPKFTPLIDPEESIDLSLDTNGDEILIDAPRYKARFSTVAKGWKTALSDISLLSKISPILRRYRIENGSMNLYYTGEREMYHFNGEIDYPYPLVMINDTPTRRYRFSGTRIQGRSLIRVNNRITINHTPDEIAIKASNTGINMPQLFAFISDYASADESKTQSSDTSPTVTIHAEHTYLHLMRGRRIVADTLDAILEGSKFDASLEHRGGTAALKIRNGLFSINGSGFNDKFMDHLFAMSDFSGGKFSFQAKGDTEAFDGIMRVENTILKDYKVLNNVLAFINTVPSLATFSLPNYNTDGLPLSEGYAHFAYNRGYLNVDNFTLTSREIKLTGETRADMKAQTLEGTLTLKTDLGSKLSKVPMVGYILFGKDGSVSTTVTIKGKLDDPKVETAIAKEIVTAPFNILKRTLVYPFLWMIDDGKSK